MSTTQPTPEDTQARQRLLTFITTYRDMLKINPSAAASAIAKMVKVDGGTGTHLLKLGIVKENPDGSRVWNSTETPDQIANKVILFRRPPAPEKPEQASNEALESLKRQLAETNARLQRVEDRPHATSKLAEDDAELIKLAVNDYAGLAARIGGLETGLGDLMRRVACGATVAPAPVVPVRKVIIGICGLFERDMVHVQQKGVELRRIDHTNGHAIGIPSGLDAIIVTADAHKKFNDAKSAYPHAAYLVTGGIKSVNTQIQLIAGGRS